MEQQESDGKTPRRTGQGQKKKFAEYGTSLSVYVPVSLAERIDGQAASEGCRRSDVILRILSAHYGYELASVA